jgi:hypothetical protein
LLNSQKGRRKLIVISKLAIAAGGISLLAITLGEIGFDPVTMIGAIAVVLGGIVVFGSNTSTFDIKTEETLRAELIGKMDLRAL